MTTNISTTAGAGGSAKQASTQTRLPLAPARPRVDSLLHLFGAWLVEASLAGVRVRGSDNSGQYLEMLHNRFY